MNDETMEAAIVFTDSLFDLNYKLKQLGIDKPITSVIVSGKLWTAIVEHSFNLLKHKPVSLQVDSAVGEIKLNIGEDQIVIRRQE
jgi:hypothetical protein